MNEAIIKQWAGQALAQSPYPNKNFPPSPYYRFLKVLAQNMHPKLSVELGVCGGGGSLHLVMGWETGTVVGVDIQDDHKENIDYIKSKYSNFRYWIGDSCEVAVPVFNYYGNVDYTLHLTQPYTYEQTMKEYTTWLSYMSDNFIICF